MKKLGKYLLITILLVLGLCGIGLIYLFFVPNSSLFGITYVRENKTYTSKRYQASEVKLLVVKSHNYPVNVQVATDGHYFVAFKSTAFGYTTKKYKKAGLVQKLEGTTLTCEITEPMGAVFENGSTITISVPAGVAVDLNLYNNNATTTFSSNKVKVGSLYYKSNGGDLKLAAGSFEKDIALDVDYSTVSFEKGATFNNNFVEFNTSAGHLIAKDVTLGDVKIISSNRPRVSLGNVNKIELKSSCGGQVKAKQVGTLDVIATDTNFDINQVNAGGRIEISKSGKVNIDKIALISDDDVIITTTTNDITIGETHADLLLTSGDGNIKVKAMTEKIVAQTTYGNINVSFADEAGAKRTNYLNAASDYGTITVSGAESIDVTLNKRARLNAQLDNVVGENHIDAYERSSVDVTVNADAVYKLITYSKSGSVDVNLAQLQTTGYTTTESTQTDVDRNSTVSDFSTVTSLLDIKTVSGSLWLRDTLTVNY